MKWIASITALVIVVAVLGTIVCAAAVETTNAATSLLLSTWLVLPYAAMGAALVVARRRRSTSLRWQVLAVAVSIVGLVFLFSIISWPSDAQRTIAALMAPVLQGLAWVLLLPAVSWALRRLRG